MKSLLLLSLLPALLWPTSTTLMSGSPSAPGGGGSSGDVSLFFGMNPGNPPTGGQVTYMPLNGTRQGWNACYDADGEEWECSSIVSIAGTLSELEVRITAADIGGTGDNVTVTARVNGTNDGSFSCAITGGGGSENSCSYSGSTVSLTAGDRFSWHVDWDGTPATSNNQFSVTAKFEGDSIEGQPISSATEIDTSSNTFLTPTAGRFFNDNTYTQTSFRTPVSGTIDDLHVAVETAPTGSTWTYTLMHNGSATGVSCQITTGTSCSDTSTSPVSVSANDDFGIRSSCTGTCATVITLAGLRWNSGDGSFLIGATGDDNFDETTTEYGHVPSADPQLIGAETGTDAILGHAITCTNFVFEFNNAGLTGAQTWDVFVREDGVDSAMGCDLEVGGDTTLCSVSGSEVFDAEDALSFSVVPGNTPNNAGAAEFGWGMACTVN